MLRGVASAGSLTHLPNSRLGRGGDPEVLTQVLLQQFREGTVGDDDDWSEVWLEFTSPVLRDSDGRSFEPCSLSDTKLKLGVEYGHELISLVIHFLTLRFVIDTNYERFVFG